MVILREESRGNDTQALSPFGGDSTTRNLIIDHD